MGGHGAALAFVLRQAQDEPNFAPTQKNPHAFQKFQELAKRIVNAPRPKPSADRIVVPRPSGCIFCGAPADSGEDLISTWMRPIISELKTDPESVGVLTLQDWSTPDAPRTVQAWPTKLPKVKRDIVCVACNTRWMSRIENDAKPFLVEMIRGNQIDLDSLARQKISNWVALKGVLAYWIQSNGRYAAQWSRAFNTMRSIPEKWHVRIGRVSGTDALNMHSAQIVMTPKVLHPLLPVSIKRETFFFTFTLGKFIGQVIGAHVIVNAPVAPDYFQTIWPPPLVAEMETPGRVYVDAVIHWPPKNWLTSDQVDQAKLHPEKPER